MDIVGLEGLISFLLQHTKSFKSIGKIICDLNILIIVKQDAQR